MNNADMIFLGDFEADLYRDYKAMLSIGLSEQDAENRIIAYYLDDTQGQIDETMFWITFAHAQWKLGRLSSFVKAAAFDRLAKMQRDSIDDRINQICQLLQSPMPPAKKPRKPTTRHCPWEVGSLLAYRIVNSEKLDGHPCFGKYALLRVVKIDRNPVTRLAPSSFYDESMRVCVYGWIGDHIPEPEIAKNLEFIPIDGSNFWVFLDWLPSKYEKPDITLLDCDHGFMDNPPSCIDFDAVPYVITHCLPFDITLAKNLSLFLKQKTQG